MNINEAVKVLNGKVLDTPKEIEALNCLLDIVKRIEVEKIADIISNNEYQLLGSKVSRGYCHNKSAQAIFNYLTGGSNDPAK